MSASVYLVFLGLSVALTQAQNWQNSSVTCCEALEQYGLQHVYYSNDTVYQERTESYWSVSSKLHPRCIVQPESTYNVVQAVNTLAKHPACTKTEFAIRSGGQMAWAYSNNIINGITIDLGLMNSTTFNETTEITSIQPGALWGSVYEKLQPLGYTVVGGRSHTAGIAGYITGGGNSFFSNQYGFATDNVKNFEIVLASGRSEVVNANLLENSDLFLVLKGGVASNYGIITRIDMYSIKSEQLWGGVAVYEKAATSQLIDAHITWVDEVGQYPPGSTVMAFKYSKDWGNITIVNFYQDTSGAVEPPVFRNFLAIPEKNNTFTTGDMNTVSTGIGLPLGYYNIWFVTTVRNDRRIYDKVVELHKRLVDEWMVESEDPDFLAELNIQAIPTTFGKNGLANGGNIMGLERIKENAIMVLFTMAVKTAELETIATEKIKAYGQEIEDFAASLDGLFEWKHLNYAGGFQDPLASYGAANIAKMRAASAKYDPYGLFQTKSSPGFKISKAWCCPN
ncbi:unnamed protein product [Periconia digitata]|uniref:FAD-binding PCMH-type domain-containing protein n=1 Tax=Periconia digitata TaxID=1303443 RepID=A0A9W4U5B7_9PLEO|nr:unnamed protein product [Periconia digitata]